MLQLRHFIEAPSSLQAAPPATSRLLEPAQMQGLFVEAVASAATCSTKLGPLPGVPNSRDGVVMAGWNKQQQEVNISSNSSRKD